MVEINLIKKDRSVIKKVNQLKQLAKWLTVLTVAAFLLQVFFWGGKTAYLSWKENKLDDEITRLTSLLKGRQKEMVEYDGIKRRLGFILEKQESSYKYTDYLSEISDWLPGGASLAAISFVNKEDIAFTLKTDNTDVYKELEERLVNLDLEASNSLFSGLKQESVSRNSQGEYLLRIIGRIK